MCTCAAEARGTTDRKWPGTLTQKALRLGKVRLTHTHTHRQSTCRHASIHTPILYMHMHVHTHKLMHTCILAFLYSM